jgi:hypothetical protein
MVLSGLRVKELLSEMADRAERLSPIEFQVAYKNFLCEVQNDL